MQNTGLLQICGAARGRTKSDRRQRRAPPTFGRRVYSVPSDSRPGQQQTMEAAPAPAPAPGPVFVAAEKPRGGSGLVGFVLAFRVIILLLIIYLLYRLGKTVVRKCNDSSSTGWVWKTCRTLFG